MPSAVGNHPHREAVGWVGAGVKILDKQLAALKISQHALVQTVETLGIDRLIDLTPPYRVLGAGLLHDIFVAGGSSCEPAGADREGASQHDFTLAAPDGMLVEDRH